MKIKKHIRDLECLIDWNMKKKKTMFKKPLVEVPLLQHHQL